MEDISLEEILPGWAEEDVRILADMWHVMNRVELSRRSPLLQPFFRSFSLAIFGENERGASAVQGPCQRGYYRKELGNSWQNKLDADGHKLGPVCGWCQGLQKNSNTPKWLSQDNGKLRTEERPPATNGESRQRPHQIAHCHCQAYASTQQRVQRHRTKLWQKQFQQ